VKPSIELSINIDVPDVEAATRFYVEAFGFSVGRRLGAVGIELLGAAVPLYLLPKASGSIAAGAAARHYGRHWTPVHLDVVVSDIEATRRRALAAGAAAEGDVSDFVWGRLALLADPFGHGVCLIEFKGGGYDELASG
jgi:lactoylglutathione lyase